MRIRYWMMKPPYAGQRYRGRGGFIYVIRADTGSLKIGISSNPISRLAQLQTASAARLTLEYAGALACDGFAIESEAHRILAGYRDLYLGYRDSEWFSCSLEVAIGAIAVAAKRLGQPIASVDPARVAEVVSAVSWAPHSSVKSVLAKCLGIIIVSFLLVALAAVIMGRASQ